MKRFPALFLAALALLISSAATAAPLDDRIPADALVYFGWSGAAAKDRALAGVTSARHAWPRNPSRDRAVPC